MLFVAASSAGAVTTRDATVVPQAASEPGGDFVYLTSGPGEGVTVREDLARARADRERRRRSLAYFAQLSDFQLADEESPARVEVLDQANSALSSAFRPQEALVPYLVDASIRQVNANDRSPITGTPLDFAITTGDNADNQQRNETRWVQTLLDGGPLNPNSGVASVDGPGCQLADPAAIAAEAPRYTGVQDYDDYSESGIFYDPDQPSGQFSAWPKYTGLMDRAQQPFTAAGLDVPSYVALGNHDALVQGNQAATAEFDRIAQGCTKVMGPAFSTVNPFTGLGETVLQTSPQNRETVPPDPDRELITKAEYRALFAGKQSDRHGFGYVDEDELAASAGAASYYAFSPAPGLRLIALDTVASGGVTGPSADGNIDDPQFKWLQEELDAAEQADELVVVYSHHGPTSLTADIPDEVAGSCDDPQDPSNPGCDVDPRDSRPIRLEDEVVATLLAERNVIAWVAGHSHVNDVDFRKDENSGFWVVRTSAEADYPNQNRLLDLVDNRDGTLSLFGVLTDDAAPPAAPPAGDAAGFTVDQLASIGRTFAYNDPQAGLGATGEPGDRNVELLIGDPRRSAGAGTAPGPRRLRASVRPRRVRAGRRTVLRVRVRSAGKPVRRARVRLADRVVRTNRRGRARLRVTLRKPGRRAVKVRKGSRRALARFRVIA